MARAATDAGLARDRTKNARRIERHISQIHQIRPAASDGLRMKYLARQIERVFIQFRSGRKHRLSAINREGNGSLGGQNQRKSKRGHRNYAHEPRPILITLVCQSHSHGRSFYPHYFCCFVTNRLRGFPRHVFCRKGICMRSPAARLRSRKVLFPSQNFSIRKNKSTYNAAASQKSITGRQYCAAFLVAAVRCAACLCHVRPCRGAACDLRIGGVDDG